MKVRKSGVGTSPVFAIKTFFQVTFGCEEKAYFSAGTPEIDRIIGSG